MLADVHQTPAAYRVPSEHTCCGLTMKRIAFFQCSSAVVVFIIFTNMLPVINMLISGLVWTMKIILFLLDLNYWFVSTFVSVLQWSIHFIFNLPVAIKNGLLKFLEGLLVFTVNIGDYFCNRAVQTASNIVESLKIVWNLLCYLLLHTGEFIQSGMLNITVSANILYQNFWEALNLFGGLIAYLVNSLVHICFTATQSVLSTALALWFLVVDIVFTGVDLVTALPFQLCYSIMSLAVLLWTPFQLTLDGLASLGRGIGPLLFKNMYEIIFLLILFFVCWMTLRPTPRVRRWQAKARQLCGMVLVFAVSVLNSDVWSRFIARIRMYITTLVNLRPRRENPLVRPARMQNPAPIRFQNPPVRPAFQQNAVRNRVWNPQTGPSILEHNIQPATVRGNCSQDPWNLLKQQEESRKCVICQDETKTVLLLPCRHLCLCASCTQTLLQQPVHQRNCPLCRQMILQTLNVYL